MVTTGAYPRKKHLKGTPIGLALALPSNSKTWLEKVYKDKPFSLLGLVISDEGKEFYNIDTWCVCIILVSNISFIVELKGSSLELAAAFLSLPSKSNICGQG